jgi:hypothetical protein
VSTRQIRTLHDFSRHHRNIEVRCYCGHKAVLPYQPVIDRFSREGWPISLGSAVGHKVTASEQRARKDGGG